MKKLILFLFLCFQSEFVFTQNNCRPPSGPTGKIETRYYNGKIKTEGFTVNGYINGEYKTYFENGQLNTFETFINGTKHGPFKYYFSSGQVHIEGEYTDGQYSGLITTYYENGTKESEEHHWFYGLTGFCRYWYTNGNIRLEADFYRGEHMGRYRFYYENGQKKIEYTSSHNGYDGLYAKYFDNGQVEESLMYYNGKITTEGENKIFFKDGSDHIVRNYHDGELSGPYQEFYFGGQIKASGNYAHNFKDNLWKYFYDSGKTKETGKYTHSTRWGKWFFYNETGNSFFEFEYAYSKGHYWDNDRVFHGIKVIRNTSNVAVRKELFYMNNQIAKAIYSRGDTIKGSLIINFPEVSNGMKIMNGRYTFDGALTKLIQLEDFKGNVLIRDNVEYNNLYVFIRDFTHDLNVSSSLFKPEYGYGFDWACTQAYHEGFFENDWLPLNLKRYQYYNEGERYYQQTSLAKGKIKEGFKVGEWYEGGCFDLYSEKVKPDKSGDSDTLDKNIFDESKIKINTNKLNSSFASGKYKKGKKEGKWKLYNHGMFYVGNFVDGMKEGKWISEINKKALKTISKEIDPEVEGQLENSLDTNYSKLISLDGQYHLNIAEGIWNYYEGINKRHFRRDWYKRGRREKTELKYFFRNGQRREFERLIYDSVVAQHYFSPFKDSVDDKLLRCTNCLVKVIDGLREGFYYDWNYEGDTTQSGNYVAGMKENTWYQFNDADTTEIANYKNDIRNGYYRYKQYNELWEGNYVNNKQKGIWTIIQREIGKRILNYLDGKVLLMEMWDVNNSHVVINGNGEVIKTYKEGRGKLEINSQAMSYVFKSVLYYKNGEVYREVDFYRNGLMKSDTYHTANGDSLAEFRSVFGGHCVEIGNGEVIEFDDMDRPKQIKHYEDGKILKIDFFDKGVYLHTTENFVSRYFEKPKVKRKINKVNSHLYNVTVEISNLPQRLNVLSLSENIAAGPEIKLLSTKSSQLYRNGDKCAFNMITFYKGNGKVILSYQIVVPPKESFDPFYNGTLEMIYMGKRFSLIVE